MRIGIDQELQRIRQMFPQPDHPFLATISTSRITNPAAPAHQTSPHLLYQGPKLRARKALVRQSCSPTSLIPDGSKSRTRILLSAPSQTTTMGARSICANLVI